MSGVSSYLAARGVSGATVPSLNPSSEGAAHTLVEKYFGSLTKSEVRQLYEKYRQDHELFGYSIEEYLSAAKDG